MNNEKISVITVTLNSDKVLKKTIESVLKQAHRPLEYIIKDGCSKDDTQKIAESYRDAFQQAGIEYKIVIRPDSGISDAFNQGIETATGAIISIINADDKLAEGALNEVDACMKENVDVVCGDLLWSDEKTGVSYVRKSKMELEKLKYQMVLMHPACFVRKRAYEAWGAFDVNLKFVMDKDLMARFYQNKATFRYVPKILAIMAAGGTSDINTDKVMREGIIVAKRNGVPSWKAEANYHIKKIRHKVVKLIPRKGKG